MFFLAVDIMATLTSENVRFDLAEGMVLIDEIGTHLHPRWRMEVVSRLRKAFPKIRFIVTSHEPLCLRGLIEGETIVLTKNEHKEIIALTELPDPSELRIDQILTSDFFGLKSTIDPQTEKLFDEYYKILALEEKDRSEEQKNRILELSHVIPRIKHLGDTEREELAYYVIDELLARKTRKDGLKIKNNLETEALIRIKSIWKSLDNKSGLL
ncbi:AAA family ATPase [Sphingobacterium sp. ML3W]|uniref:AAA family ATPase n=1 Tax=Sphingobacterium sp. ML3W TaxID=1538644 RepID=UPI001F2586AC|nr:AAA family ATPase [Sphingobacterium sp. ML3W]